MKKLYLVTTSVAVILLLTGCAVFGQNQIVTNNARHYNILYFNPEIYPDIHEIKEPTYTAFFSALSDQLSSSRANKLLRVDYDMAYDDTEGALIAEFCENNNAQFAVVPKVKYFKVGLGKYVFSNQVVVSLKVYTAGGDLMAETSYDTYKKGGRLVGSAENSIKVGTSGALKNLNKILRKKYRSQASGHADFELMPSEALSQLAL